MAINVETEHAVEILSGNEAIARGAWEAGVKLAAAYPGTPSTEVLEELAKYEGVYSEWSPNEKVAMEVGIGASMAGGRALVCMKHVGLNVAADPFFSSAYIGLEAGMVVVSADDPGMHSSQDEQDNRNYAKFARVPLLEPSDSGEAKDFMVAAYELSERFDTPVLFRTTTRTAHSKSLVTFGERVETDPVVKLKRNYNKYVMMPANATARHPLIEQRVLDLAVYAEDCPFNRIEMGDPAIGIITSGSAYGYTREALPGASYLKLGMTYPLPKKMIADFRARVEKLYIVEELDPFLEEAIRLMGIKIDGGKELNTLLGEISPSSVARSLAKAGVPGVNPELLVDVRPAVEGLPSRPPTLCPGCSHRGIFTVLKKLRVFVSGDIGCYTLGALEPFNSVHASTCMGASISMAHGMSKVQQEPARRRRAPRLPQQGGRDHRRQHLLSLRHHLPHGRRLQQRQHAQHHRRQLDHGHDRRPGEPGHRQDPPRRPLPVGRPPGPRTRPGHQAGGRPSTTRTTSSWSSGCCARNWLPKKRRWSSPNTPASSSSRSDGPSYQVDAELCIGCKRCLQAGCMALNLIEDAAGERKVEIDPAQCNGCGICAQLCKEDAIARPAPAEGGKA